MKSSSLTQAITIRGIEARLQTSRAHHPVRQFSAFVGVGELAVPGHHHQGAHEGAKEGQDVRCCPLQWPKAIALQQTTYTAESALRPCGMRSTCSNVLQV